MTFRILLAVLALLLATLTTTAAPLVAVIEDTSWSPDDAARDGAAELGVLLRLAQLQQRQPVVGLVGVGDRRGIFQDGIQRGLEFAVTQGVPVVRLARGDSACTEAEADFFIDGGNRSPEAAVALLAHCLAQYGALPKIPAPQIARDHELAALRQKLAQYRAAFSSPPPAAPAMVAMR